MKGINIVLGMVGFGIWGYSLYDKWGIGINIILGLLSLLMLFFDDLLYKPLDLIGFIINKEEKSLGDKK